MPATLYVAPAAAGKTHFVLAQLRAASRGLAALPLLCVPVAAQAGAARRRLAQMGGAMGVRICTLDQLYAALLENDSAPNPAAQLPDVVLHQFMRRVIAEQMAAGRLPHYAAIATMPGFVAEMQRIVAELKAAHVQPAALAEIFEAQQAPPRLREIACLYAAWQETLHSNQWTDAAGLAWQALDGLEQNRIVLPAAWSPIVFDGFASFTTVQLAIIRAIACLHARTVVVTLTGDAQDRGETPARTAHARFHATRRELEATLGIAAQALPILRPAETYAPAIHALHEAIFTARPPALPEPHAEAESVITLVEASNPALEVRAALRWLKQRICVDGVPPEECAIVARSLAPYSLLIEQIADEYGMPVRMEDGQPLTTNPAIAALLNLLALLRPGAGGRMALPRRPLVAAWRSPYFDWRVLGAQAGDAELLDQAGRVGLVGEHPDEWRAGFALMLEQAARAADEEAEEEPPQSGYTAADIERVRAAFEAFVVRLAPRDYAPINEHVAWLEDLIGPFAEGDEQPPLPLRVLSLDIPACMRGAGAAPPAARLLQRDLAALLHLKRVLGDLLWAGALGSGDAPIPFGDFLDALEAAAAAAWYTPPTPPHALIAAPTTQLRGVPVAALAVLGMAEGQLPARLHEDAFLRDADRVALQQAFSGIRLSTTSAEAEFFLDTLARPQRALLLTRPRLTQDGSAREPSPYWYEVCRRTGVAPRHVALGRPAPPHEAASPAELWESMATCTLAADDPIWQMPAATAHTHLQAAGRIVAERAASAHSAWDGALDGPALQGRFGSAETVWSPSALEAYRACPFGYFVNRRLRLDQQADPDEGPSAAQIGTLCHAIFQRLYAPFVDAEQPPTRAELLSRLPAIADAVLNQGPRRLGFRPPPGWARQCDQMREQVRRSINRLVRLGGIPAGVELHFGGDPVFEILPPDEVAGRWPTADGAPRPLRLRGVIDRVDRMPDGSLLVIDYKLGGSSYAANKLGQWRKLQLPLYAAAARAHFAPDARVDGFYFSVQTAERTDWTLQDAALQGKYGDLTQAAAIHAAGAAAAIIDGDFAPAPPEEGCPSYCAAAAFCWHYKPSDW